MDEKTPTYGGYSTQIVVDEDYVLQDSRRPPARDRRAAALRGDHDVLAAAALKVGEGRASASWAWAGSGTWA